MEVETTKPQNSTEPIPGIDPALSKRILAHQADLAQGGGIYAFQAPANRSYYRLRWYAFDPLKNKKVFKSFKIGDDPQTIAGIRQWLDKIQLKRAARRKRREEKQKQTRLWHLGVIASHLVAVHGGGRYRRYGASRRIIQAGTQSPLAVLQAVSCEDFLRPRKRTPKFASDQGGAPLGS
jgi:hypothetical protein